VTNQFFRSANTPQGIVVFPFPPIKGKKWLIRVNTLEIAKELIENLSSGSLPIPIDDKNLESYKNVGLHSDNKTPVYSLKDEDFHSK
jgi:hypothetical protein